MATRAATPGGLVTDDVRAIDGIGPRRGRPGPRQWGLVVVSQQAMAGLLDSYGLPAGRDWRRRRRTDQLRDLVSC